MALSSLRIQPSIHRLLHTPPSHHSIHHHRHHQRSPFSNLPPKKTSTSQIVASSATFPKIRFVNWYLGILKTRPLVTKSISSCLIYIASDLTSQTIALPSSATYDFTRTTRMAGYGLVVLGPAQHFWFNFLSRLFPGRDLMSTVKKMAMGQSMYGPLMTAIFFTVNAALQGEQSGEIVARLKRDLLPTLLNGVKYWPVCDFITFRFVPVHLQPLVSNSFAYIWTVYLTKMANLEKAT